MSLEGFNTFGSVSGQSVPIPDGFWVELLLPYNGVTWWYLKGVLAHVSTQSWWLSLSVASILTRPFTILHIKTSLTLRILSSNVGHFSSSSMLVTDEVLWYHWNHRVEMKIKQMKVIDTEYEKKYKSSEQKPWRR